ncbi:MAG: hypothetical protein J5832_04085 [Clostridia bacterium]|nr:hypothetical protein [Clostridia bacterium]
MIITDNQYDIFNGGAKRSSRMLGRCAQCGFAVYSENGALRVNDTGELIHEDCWSEYSEEHMFELAEKVTPQKEE